MPSLSTTYLIPAILLNPAFILHIINTFVSHILPPPPTVSHSPHPFMESIGPVPGAKPYLDMHADDQLCWSYTAIMVLIQVLAFGRVQDNRDARKTAKAAKLEREKLRKEREKEEERKISLPKANGHAVGLDGAIPEQKLPNGTANGNVKSTINAYKTETESEDSASVTETSEEEMIV